jgi:hypothetical protein
MDPPPRRGRRDNGLDAVAFVPLADVDPRIGEHLLEVLGAAGVPAYLEPSVDVEPYTRALALPSPPSDRLWVDRDQRLAARQIVEAEAEQAGQTGPGRAEPVQQTEDLPSVGLDDADEELIWRQIVEAYEADEAFPATPVPPWPVVEDADEPAGPGGAGPGADPGRPDDDQDVAGALPGGRGDRPEGAGPADAPAGDALPAEDDDHYRPPPSPPVPRLSRQALLAVTLLLIGVLLLAVPSLVGLDQEAGMLFGMVSILSGGALLVLRLRDSRSDDDPDDGAVV